MPRGKDAFATKYTKAQKRACVHAVMVDGMTAAQAGRAARAGQLPGVGKFAIPDNYVALLVRREKNARDPQALAEPGEARTAIEEARARVLAWILREADRYEQQCKTGQVDLAQAGRLLRALTEWEKGQTRRPEAQPGEQDDPGDDGQDEAETLVQGLLERANGNGSNATAKAADPVSPADEGETESSDLPA